MANVMMPQKKDNSGAYGAIGQIGGAIFGGPGGAAAGKQAGQNMSGPGAPKAAPTMDDSGVESQTPQPAAMAQPGQENMSLETPEAMKRYLARLNQVSAQSGGY